MSSEPCDRYAEALGSLVGNFHTLEFALRLALYLADTEPARRMPRSVRFTALRAGDSLPLSHLSSYDSLGALIGAYNRNARARGDAPEVDEALVDLRDTIAHGRVLADQPVGPLVAVKFAKPGWRDEHAKVEFAYELTIDALRQHRDRVADAVRPLWARIGALGVGTPA
jgi:hypothetical protein